MIRGWRGRGGGVFEGCGGACGGGRCTGGRGVLEGVLCPFSHGVHIMPPCFDFLRMSGILNEKSKKLIKILIIPYTKMMNHVFLKQIFLC